MQPSVVVLSWRSLAAGTTPNSGQVPLDLNFATLDCIWRKHADMGRSREYSFNRYDLVQHLVLGEILPESIPDRAEVLEPARKFPDILLQRCRRYQSCTPESLSGTQLARVSKSMRGAIFTHVRSQRRTSLVFDTTGIK